MDRSPSPRPSRRESLKFLAAGIAGMALGRPAFAAAMRAEGLRAPLFDISLAQWSYNKAIFAKKLDPIDFPKISKTDHGITNVEYVNQFYTEKAKDEAYWKELRKRCDDLGVTSKLIMCDSEGELGDADEKKRDQAVENHKKWATAAKILGCHSIRVNAYSSGTPEEQMKRVADGLKKLTTWTAKETGLNVIVENHGGLSSTGDWIVGVMKLVGDAHCGTLPDFGNFNLGGGKTYDRYKGVEEMMPYAKAVSAKTYDFDAKGEESTIDYTKMMKIVLAAGYHGCLGIEYEGKRLSEPDGINATKRLLEKIRTDLSPK